MHARLGELERRVGNLGRFGKVAQADYENARVKVQIGRNLTDWLPWMTARAGGDRTWHAPEVGEQVFVMSVAGDFNCGVVFPGIFQQSASAPGNSPDLHIVEYKDGSVIQYDRAQHILTANLTSAGKSLVITGAATTEQTNEHVKASINSTLAELTDGQITLSVGSTSITVTASGIQITVGGMTAQFSGSGMAVTGGNVTTDGDVTAGTISLKNHLHGGVQSGTSETSPPVP